MAIGCTEVHFPPILPSSYIWNNHLNFFFNFSHRPRPPRCRRPKGILASPPPPAAIVVVPGVVVVAAVVVIAAIVVIAAVVVLAAYTRLVPTAGLPLIVYFVSLYIFN